MENIAAKHELKATVSEYIPVHSMHYMYHLI